MKKRTDVDFSQHEVEVIKHEGVLIHKFKRPETNNCMLTFINTCGVMTVTGDFGNWVFCREFHPTSNSDCGVSDGYWNEKLRNSSEQTTSKYSSKETIESINDFKSEFADVYGREMNEDELDWIERLENNVDDETEYTYIAYREKPNSIDYDEIPFGKEPHFWLLAVYDGFDALCLKLKEIEKQ